MNQSPLTELLHPHLYQIDSLDDEVRADTRCGELLQHFFKHQCDRKKLPAQQAASLAYGADYFLREFLIGELRHNILRPRPGAVRVFAGHWYIVRNLEPNMKELEGFLDGLVPFYEFCRRMEAVDAGIVEQLAEEAEERDYFRERIESFLAIEGDGFEAWQRECPLIR